MTDVTTSQTYSSSSSLSPHSRSSSPSASSSSSSSSSTDSFVSIQIQSISSSAKLSNLQHTFILPTTFTIHQLKSLFLESTTNIYVKSQQTSALWMTCNGRLLADHVVLSDLLALSKNDSSSTHNSNSGSSSSPSSSSSSLKTLRIFVTIREDTKGKNDISSSSSNPTMSSSSSASSSVPTHISPYFNPFALVSYPYSAFAMPLHPLNYHPSVPNVSFTSLNSDLAQPILNFSTNLQNPTLSANPTNTTINPPMTAANTNVQALNNAVPPPAPQPTIRTKLSAMYAMIRRYIDLRLMLRLVVLNILFSPPNDSYQSYLVLLATFIAYLYGIGIFNRGNQNRNAGNEAANVDNNNNPNQNNNDNNNNQQENGEARRRQGRFGFFNDDEGNDDRPDDEIELDADAQREQLAILAAQHRAEQIRSGTLPAAEQVQLSWLVLSERFIVGFFASMLPSWRPTV